MKAATVLLLALALTGCATCDRHPIVCSVAIASVALSVPSLVNHHTGTRGTDGRDVHVPGLDCQKVSCR